ncbi:type II toxin-antitoxin system RelE family toxin [Amycolatopsis alkalitolerans]|uniref:Type II toxin-antitoxin system RelE/ParE family toxin n=1 Tax=Amycolatopsis alkalitolerans TaxID=2547244 RepID=A0A5C4M7Y3_9PSEU|nr:type II toxin-antitoxin system RelE/ParE family toxin [Amycolatopsis alkalitolerans]
MPSPSPRRPVEGWPSCPFSRLCPVRAPDRPGRRYPYRLGKPLDEPFHEVWTTRRGEYRALYSTDDIERTVTVLAVAHRRDAYRPG